MADTLHVRKAIAGIYLAEGATQKEALTRAGFAPGTARAPHKGLRAAQCIAEAEKLDSAGIVSRLPRLIRSKLAAAIEDTDPNSANLQRLVRAADHIEKFHGAGKDQLPESGPRGVKTIIERLEFVQNLTIIARERGILPDPIGESRNIGDASSAEPHPRITSATPQVIDAQCVTGPASDNDESVNRENAPVNPPNRPDPADF